jgi:hypothetical protein
VEISHAPMRFDHTYIDKKRLGIRLCDELGSGREIKRQKSPLARRRRRRSICVGDLRNPCRVNVGSNRAGEIAKMDNRKGSMGFKIRHLPVIRIINIMELSDYCF